MFPYEKWKVYRLALELRDSAAELSRVRVPGCAKDMDQLRRAASSVVYNLAEGALHQQKGKKLDFYRTALGSAGESNAALTFLHGHHSNRRLIVRGREIAEHIAADQESHRERRPLVTNNSQNPNSLCLIPTPNSQSRARHSAGAAALPFAATNARGMIFTRRLPSPPAPP
jgi:four helix bundle protein